MNAFEGDSAQPAFVSIASEEASPTPYPFSTASLPPKMCVGMCVKLPSPTQHSVTGTHLFTHSLTFIHVTPPHTLLGACSVTHSGYHTSQPPHIPQPNPISIHIQSPCSWSLSHPTMCGRPSVTPPTFIHTGMCVSPQLARPSQRLGQLLLLMCYCCYCCC